MWAWRPVPTLMKSFITFLIFGCVFIIIGILLIYYSSKIYMKEIDYGNGDENDPCNIINSECEVEFELEHTITEPVMFYYKLENFYQNHRHYIESWDWD